MENHKNKTKVELIIELIELQQKLSVIESANTNDISNKKLLENDEHYRYLFECNPQPMWIYDIETLSFLEINDAAVHHYGYSREEFLGMTLKDIRPKEDIEALQKDIELTQQPYNIAGEWRHLKKDGAIIFVEIISHVLTFNNRKARHVMVNDITERKQVKEKLRESEYRFRKLYEDGANGMVMAGKDFKFRMANRTFCQMTGYQEEELQQLTFADITHPDDRTKDVPLMAGEIDVYRTEKRYLNKNGLTFWAQLTVSPIYDSNGQFLYFVGIIVNVTDRKKSEEILKESHALIKIAGEKAKLGGWNVNIGENRVYWSDEVAAIHERPSGYSPSVEEGINFYAPEWHHKIKKAIANCVGKGISFDEEMQIITATGKRVWVNTIGEAVRDVKGKIVKVQGAFQDISERKRAEESLRQSEENLAITLNSIGDGVIATDLLGLVVNMNPIAEKLCGWSSIDAAGMPLTEVFNIVSAATRETIINPVKKVLENGEVLGLSNHTVLISKNGTEYQISDSAAPIKNKEGKISGVVLVFSDVTEKYLTAQSLMENEERLNLFFNQSLTGFFFMMIDEPVVWNESVDKEKTLDNVFGHLRVTKVNQAMLDQYLATEDEMINRTLNEFFAHDIKQGRRVIRDLFDKGTLHIDTSELRSDGILVWIEGDYICLYDSKGSIKGLFGTQHDITDRKNALIDLQLSKMELEAYFEDDISADYILSVDGYVLSCNNTFLKLFGLEKKPDPGILNIIDFYKNPEQSKLLITRLSKERKIENYLVDFVSVDGKDINAILNAIGIFDENDKLIKIRGYIVDITNQKKAEESLKLFRTLIDNSNDSFEVVDPATARFLDVNETGCKELGYSRDEFLKLSVYDIDPLVNPQSFAEMAKEIRKSNSLTWEGIHIRKDGTSFPVEVNIRIAKLKKEYLVTVARDITERKKIMEDLIIAKEHAEQSDKLKSAFLANMSHEIRTPMNGILGFTELLKSPDLSSEKQQKYINVIKKSGARLLNIINDIVDISKIEAGLMKTDIKASNLKEQIEYIYTFFKPEAERKGIQFFVKNSSLEEDLMIETDREKIYAIFTNLIKNALKFTNKGLIIFGYERKEEYLEFYVKDTGIGIPQDKHKAIFERFIQADISDKMAFQGAGLGLSITKAYVELLGGKIWVESELENLTIGKPGGSTFYFTIPCNASPTMKTSSQKPKSSDKTVKKEGDLKILIAEDDEASSLYLSILAEEFSSEILMARNGIEAVEIYKNNPDIDLILMDIQMPYLNGYEATQQIHQLNKNVVIIAQTAYALSFDRQKVIDAGCNDYITKPISRDKLAVLIRKYFN